MGLKNLLLFNGLHYICSVISMVFFTSDFYYNKFNDNNNTQYIEKLLFQSKLFVICKSFSYTCPIPVHKIDDQSVFVFVCPSLPLGYWMTGFCCPFISCFKSYFSEFISNIFFGFFSFIAFLMCSPYGEWLFLFIFEIFSWFWIRFSIKLTYYPLFDIMV